MEQRNIKGTMKVSIWLSMHLCLAQRLVELVYTIATDHDMQPHPESPKTFNNGLGHCTPHRHQSCVMQNCVFQDIYG